MNTDFIKGVIVPIITVIDEEEKINEAAMRAQVDYVINGGLHGILAFGSNGEFYQIEEEEMERGFKIMVDQGCWKSSGLLWYRRYQYKEMCPPGKNGSGKWRSRHFHFTANVFKTEF